MSRCVTLWVTYFLYSLLDHAGAINNTHIVIGQTGPLTGLQAAYGSHLALGQRIAFEEANAAGGVHGRIVTLVTLDDGYEPGPALSNFDKLYYEHDALLLAGVFGTPIVTALFPKILATGMPYVGPYTGAPITRTPFHEEIINVRASYDTELAAHAAFLVEHLRVQRIACLYQNDTFGMAGYQGLVNALAYVGMQLVASGVYTRNTLDVESAVEVIAGAIQTPQAVVMVSLEPQNLKFIQLFRQHPRADPNCSFILMSVGASPSFPQKLGKEHWHHLYFFGAVPMLDDPRWEVAKHFSLIAPFHLPNGTQPDSIMFEGYINGRFVVDVLRGINGANITRDSFRNQVYNTRMFVIDDLILGLYSRQYTGCEAVLCACNSGLRNVFMAVLDPSTGLLRSDLSLPDFRYPATSCTAPVSLIHKPLLFGQLVPVDDSVSAAVAMDIGAGVQTAFDEANAAGGIRGRLFELIQYNYSGDPGPILESLLDRYPLMAILGSVVPTSDAIQSPVPTIATYAMNMTPQVPPFFKKNIEIQPSIALEIMALVDFARQSNCPVHFRTPATTEGSQLLTLMVKSIHTFQAKPTSSAMYERPEDAMRELTNGCMIGIGRDDDDLQMWVKELETRPQLHLLTVSRTAIRLLASNMPLTSSFQRVYYPSLLLGAWNQSLSRGAIPEAWDYGNLAGQAVVQTLTRSAFALENYNVPAHLLSAWYDAKLIKRDALTLGPYSSNNCSYLGDTDCLCNQGVRTLAIVTAMPDSPVMFVYSSSSCNVSYLPLEDPQPIIIGATIGGSACTLIIAMVLWIAMTHGKRNNSTAPKDPSQPFCVIFTDIQSSTHLWATIPEVMAIALDTHHSLIRQLIAKYKCYEVKTIGDSFMCVTGNPIQALQFALALQRCFFEHQWNTMAIDELYHQTIEDDTPVTCWNGLRVRIGIHFGFGDIKLDPVSKGYDYYGTVVNTAARIESVCHGGQIGISEDLYNAVCDHSMGAVFTDLGMQTLRGLADPIHLYQVLPSGDLSGRQFPALRIDRSDAMEDEADTDMASCCPPSPRRRNSALHTQYSVSSVGLTGKWADTHPLVVNGSISADDLRRHYQIIQTALTTLLATQAKKLKDQAVDGFCTRLHVPNHGTNGLQLQKTLHGLIKRILPATVVQVQGRRSSITSRMSSCMTPTSGRRNGPMTSRQKSPRVPSAITVDATAIPADAELLPPKKTIEIQVSPASEQQITSTDSLKPW